MAQDVLITLVCVIATILLIILLSICYCWKMELYCFKKNSKYEIGYKVVAVDSSDEGINGYDINASSEDSIKLI